MTDKTGRHTRIERRTPIATGGSQVEVTESHEGARPGRAARARAGARKAQGHLSRPIPRVLRGHTPNEHLLMAEFTGAVGIIALRAIADYVPNSDQSQAGEEKPSTGAHPLTVLSATLVVYFVLSLAVRGPKWFSRAALLFGALMDLTLLLRSQSQLNTVAGWFEATSPTKPKPIQKPTPVQNPVGM